MERTSQFFHETLSFYEAINRKGRARHLRFLQGDGRKFTKLQKIPEGKVSARDKLLLCLLTEPSINSQLASQLIHSANSYLIHNTVRQGHAIFDYKIHKNRDIVYHLFIIRPPKSM